MLTFDDLTSPATPDEFFAKYWTRQAVHLRDPQRSFAACFDWTALNAVLNSGDLEFPTTVVSRNERVIPAEEFTKGADGRVVDVPAVMKLFRDGASFSVRGAASYWPPLKSILACLHDALFESVHANVYCSPANTQGFRCHYDLHEVFVLQIEGTKHWRVFAPTTQFPVEPWRPEDAPADTDEAYVDVTLEKGDVLYVPRGHWHYAVARDSPSLHITVGVTCRKGDAFLEWLRPELLAESAWRRNVPSMGGPTAEGRLPLGGGLAEWTAELRQALLDKLAEPGLLERFAADLFADTSPTVTAHMPLDGAAGPLPIEDVIFRRPTGQRHLIAAAGESSVTIKVAGLELTLEDVSRTLVTRIFGSASFTLRDVQAWEPAASREEVAELLEHLVRSGLLVAEPRSGESIPSGVGARIRA